MEYARKCKELANARKADGAIAIVAIDASLRPPSRSPRMHWPRGRTCDGRSKDRASDKLKIKYPKGALKLKLEL